MKDDPIKAALRAAHREAPSFYTEGDTARIVAAFLHALPHGSRVPEADDPKAPGWSWEHWIGRDLAAAVERAAQEETR